MVRETETESYNTSINSTVPYDLLGNLSKETQLTRSTIAKILQAIDEAVFNQYKMNPEDFLAKNSSINQRTKSNSYR